MGSNSLSLDELVELWHFRRELWVEGLYMWISKLSW